MIAARTGTDSSDHTGEAGTTPTSGDNLVTPCTSCPHTAIGHDPVSRRWCAATAESGAARRCICPPDALVAPLEDILTQAAAGAGAAAVPKDRAPAGTLPRSYADRMRAFGSGFDVEPSLVAHLADAAAALDLVAEGLRKAADRSDLTTAQRSQLDRLRAQLR
jgi:hypothetical protein